MISAMIESFSESYALLEKYGVDPQNFYKLMTSSLFNSPAHKTYGDLILVGNFDVTGFSLKLGFKDVSLIKEAAKDAFLPLPLASILEERFLRALSKGWDYKDWTAVSDLAREDAGLPKKNPPDGDTPPGFATPPWERK
jgi:3-hydroxyisobutyrate dehydrogenase-like beta-hydroxyacid dehydrogenase